MGFNVNYEKGMSGKAIVNFYFLGGWNHYFLDSLKNNASFKDASLNKFYTKSKLSNQGSYTYKEELILPIINLSLQD